MKVKHPVLKARVCKLPISHTVSGGNKGRPTHSGAGGKGPVSVGESKL